MSDKISTEASAASASPAPPKKQAEKSARAKSTHPSTSDMVVNAITSLNDSSGSSFQAIKKFIASTYKVEGKKQSSYIKKYLKMAIDSGILVQTKGRGASGSFKLKPTKSKKNKVSSKPKTVADKRGEMTIEKTPTKKQAAEKKSEKKAEKKTDKKTEKKAEKKTPVAKKPAIAKKAVAAKQSKKQAAKKVSVKPAAKKTMTKKTVKSPAKPKTPKPKKTATKTAPKKK